jgi:HD superfamily phosphodiesterase
MLEPHIKTDMSDTWYEEGIENLLEPIQLTPQILEKNGFEKEGVIELYNLYAGIDHRVTIHDDKEYMNSNNEWYVHVDSEDYSTIAGCELTYLHELQHILRLCKIDFEFIL